MRPAEYRDLPPDERYELEEYIFLQVLKEASRAKYEADNAKRVQAEAAKKREAKANAPALANVVDNGFDATIEPPPAVRKRTVGRPRK